MLKRILAVMLTVLLIGTEAICVDAAVSEDAAVDEASGDLTDNAIPEKSISGDTAAGLMETEEGFITEPAHSGEEITAAEDERERSAVELGYVPGEILVMYDGSVSGAAIEETAGSLDGIVTAVIENDESTLAVVEISEETTVDTAVEEYRSDPDIIMAEPNYIMLPMDGPGVSGTGFDYLSAVHAAGEDGAFSLSGDSVIPVDVGVIDAGFDTSDLSINGKISSDSITIINSAGEYTALTETGGTHGTNVAAVLAAAAGPALREMVLVDASEGSDGGYLTVGAVAAAVAYLTPRVRVINMSIGTDNDSTMLAEAVDNAYRNGVTIICAAGNGGPGSMTWPACYSNTISVMASDSSGGLWDRSGTGDISAPGTDILCTDGALHSGTSLSAAMVSAAAAALLSLSSDLSFPRIREILISSADSSGGTPVLNMADAVRLVKGTSSGVPDLSDADVNTDSIKNGIYSEDWTDNIVLTYNGSELKKDTDYTVDEESITESVEGDTVLLSAAVKGMGSYIGSIAVETETNKRDVSVCTYSLQGSYAADGNPVRPEVILTWEGTDHLRYAKTLTEGTDYSLSYGENIAAGEAAGEILVTGLGYYCGTKEIRFDIYAPEEAVGTVQVGSNIVCSLYPEGTLYFEGTGDMPGLVDENEGLFTLRRPYKDLADEYGIIVSKVIIGEGITSVAGQAFQEFTELKEVVLPAGLNSIGLMAFYKCGMLKSVTLPEGLSEISWQAFAYSGLETMFLPDGARPGQEVFYCCRSLKSLRLPPDLETIEMGLCKFCSSLQSVVLPDILKSIERHAFDECTALDGIELPVSLERIGDYALRGVREIVYLGSAEQWGTVENGCDAASNSAKLRFLIEPDNGGEDGNGNIGEDSSENSGSGNSDSDNNTGGSGDSGSENPESDNNAGSGENDNSETSGENTGGGENSSEDGSGNSGSDDNTGGEDDLSAGNSCGENAFWSLDAEGKLTVRGTGAINAYSDGVYVWSGIADQIRTVEIRDGITDTGETSFAGLKSMISISLPDSLQYIGSRAFAGCISLTEVGIPGSVTEIREKAFYGCSGLTKAVIRRAGSQGVSELKKIRSDAFAWCESLESVNVESALFLRSVGTRAFESCISLQKLEFSNSITTIGAYAFYNCRSLEYCHFPGLSIRKIGKAAFGYCTALQNVSQYGSLESLGDAAFIGCTSLEHAGVMTNSAPLAGIGAYTFYNCSKLEMIDFTEHLKTIGDYAFYGSGIIGGCDQQIRSEVTLGKKLESVGRFAFANCSNLKKVNFQGADTVIGAYAFYNDPELTTVLLPRNLTRLEDGTFAFCSALKTPESSIAVEKGENVFAGAAEAKDISAYEKVPAVLVVMAEGSCMTLKGYKDPDAEAFSSDETIASVIYSSDTGYSVCAKAPGTAYVVYSGTDGRLAKWKIRVKQPEDAELKGEYKDDGSWQTPGYDCSHISCRTVVVSKAGCTSSGLEKKVCIRCGKTISTAVIPSVSRIWLSYTSITYNGRVRKPGVTIRDSRGRSVSSENYTIYYSNSSSTNAGTYKVTVRFKGTRYTGSKTLTYRITKAANTFTGVTASKKLKYSVLKTSKKSFYIAASVKENAAKTFSLVSVSSKAEPYITVSSAGKVTVKKGIPKGAHSIKVKIRAAATANYKITYITKKITITVG